VLESDHNVIVQSKCLLNVVGHMTKIINLKAVFTTKIVVTDQPEIDYFSIGTSGGGCPLRRHIPSNSTRDQWTKKESAL
jgi:hypothetical protein